MSTIKRIDGASRIDPAVAVTFQFDGKSYSGFKGDTLASALLANGVSIFGRSFKYHRPRGLLGAGIEEPNALITVIDGTVREPNCLATMVEIHDGLIAESQNRFPNLRFDMGAINQVAAPVLGAGFYYKTFMGPKIAPLMNTKFWMFCEKFIRKAAGLGKVAPLEKDPAHYDRMNMFCDLLVIGGGIAGLVAAQTAAARGKRVIVADLNAEMGGAALWSDSTYNGLPATQFVRDILVELAEKPKVTLLPRTTIWGRYDGNIFAGTTRTANHRTAKTGEPRQRHLVIRTEQTLLATGATERPLIFSGNDRPNVMLASSLARYVAEFGVAPWRNVCIFTNNDSAYQVAYLLANRGLHVNAIIDMRDEISDAARELATVNNIEIILSHGVISTDGPPAISAISIAPIDAEGNADFSKRRALKCDALGMSGGWTPLIQLATQMGEKPIFDKALQSFLPPQNNENDLITIGAASGTFNAAAIIQQAFGAGEAPQNARMPEIVEPDISAVTAPLCVVDYPKQPGRKKQKAFVDFQHDVTSNDIAQAHREGFVSVEHLKRYTTLGMATDQGRNANMASLAIMAKLRGMAMEDAGTTRFRPPFSGVTLGSIAAERTAHLMPNRLTPMQDWHAQNGAQTYSAGLWHRPMAYFQDGETLEQAYVRETKAVREKVGLVDVSTLGKIRVVGPDAGQFLDHIYTGIISTLPINKARYGLMLREDGLLFDDGTVWRLGELDYLVTTTTANAGRVMDHLEYYKACIWPDLKCAMSSVSDQWAAMAIAGPSSRDVLTSCVKGTKVDDATLPHMGIVHGEIDGVNVMIARLSFSGERAYEIYCPSGHGTKFWQALLNAGAPFGITPYGLEALGALRIEKGHITGAEMNGRTTAQDLGLGGLLSKKKSFIGSQMLARDGLWDQNRKILVGLISTNGQSPQGGAHLVQSKGNKTSLGHITAIAYSPMLGTYIGLALLENSHAHIGKTLHIADPLRDASGDTTMPVKIVSPHMFDPKGERMHG